MLSTRTLVFLGSVALSAVMLFLFAAGFFDKKVPQVAYEPSAPVVRIAQDQNGGDQGGDADQGTEVQQSEVDQQSQDNQDDGGPH